jgi:GH43 family beta-xylosidase
MFYVNPVYPRSCPDPFVLKYCGEFWCYSTGWAPDGRVFEVLRSSDLVRWESIGGAMEPLPGAAPEYWAPEVACSDGVFYLYYSVGDGVQMRLRVAVSSSPDGPFLDSGRQLTNDDFAIDAHVFEDDGGTRYLFYAKDFLEHTHVGTGTVVDRMIDSLTLEGKPRPVSLPRYDWQVFDPHRVEKGGVRWHTVEGPFVLKYKSRYYQMFSGGNWKNLSYGVSYALADSLDVQQEWNQLEHNEKLPLVLSTIPGKVVGPGHNSVVRGPDNRQLFCVYHRWAADESLRLLSIDRLEFIGERLAVLGPSTTPQEAPAVPLYPIFQELSGLWEKSDRELLQNSAQGNAETVTVPESDCFLAEVSVKTLTRGQADPDAVYGLRLLDGARTLLSLEICPARSIATVLIDHEGRCILPLASDFHFDTYHLLRIEVDGPRISLWLGSRAHSWTGLVPRSPRQLSFFTRKIACSFKACQLTRGFEDLFWEQGNDLRQLGWNSPEDATGDWQIINGEMLQADSSALNSVVVKEHLFSLHELVINARLHGGDAPDSWYGFYPVLVEPRMSPLLRVEIRQGRPHLAWYSQDRNGAWLLPGDFDRCRAEQFRFLRTAGKLQVFREADHLGDLEIPEEPSRVALYANRAAAGFDLVRAVGI